MHLALTTLYLTSKHYHAGRGDEVDLSHLTADQVKSLVDAKFVAEVSVLDDLATLSGIGERRARQLLAKFGITTTSEFLDLPRTAVAGALGIRLVEAEALGQPQAGPPADEVPTTPPPEPAPSDPDRPSMEPAPGRRNRRPSPGE